jgi:hypothetical protein
MQDIIEYKEFEEAWLEDVLAGDPDWTCPLGVEGWDQNVMRL